MPPVPISACMKRRALLQYLVGQRTVSDEMNIAAVSLSDRVFGFGYPRFGKYCKWLL
jgi:hypothetical protein